jgi:hypothetical protein
MSFLQWLRDLGVAPIPAQNLLHVSAQEVGEGFPFGRPIERVARRHYPRAVYFRRDYRFAKALLLLPD